MNVYDFDKTIYDGDSTADFIFYCIKHFPKTLLRLPATAWAYLLYISGIYKKTRFKEKMYGFLRYVPNIDKAVSDFWRIKRSKLKKWYLEQKRNDDLIISASPEFLLAPVCSDMGIEMMASRVDKHTGKYDGENCHGKEKVRRLYEKISNPEIEEFYSDSLSDTPLAELAKHAYLVNKDTRIPWESYKPNGADKLKKTFLSKEFIMFIAVGVINTFNGVVLAWIYSAFIKNANIAFAAGYITSTVISYILNSFFTFKEKLSVKKYVKFFISYIPNFIIQNLAVAVFYNMLGWHKLIAYALAAVVGVPLTFLFMKVFTFKKRN